MRIRYFVGIALIVLFCLSGFQPVSAYGEISPESITSFSETIDDDEFLYPDSDLNESYRNLGSVAYSDDCSDITRWTNFAPTPWDTHEVLDSDWLHLGFTGAVPNDDARTDNIGPDSVDGDTTRLWFAFNWTHTDFDLCEDELDLIASGTGGTDTIDLSIYAIDTVHYIDLDWSAADDITNLFVDTTVDTGESVEVWFDWIIFDSRTNLEFRSDVYSKSFADVSNWVEGTFASSTPEGTFTSDGDIGSFEDNYIGAENDNDGWYTNGPSFSSTDYYFEIRYKINTTAINWQRIYFFTSDDQGGTYSYQQLVKSTAWTTTKEYIPSLTGTGLTAIESVLIIVQSSSTANFSFDIDYLRIFRGNESGWQHDGSTTQGITTYANTATSTDGDEITVSKTGGSYGSIDLYIDATTTRTCLDPDYYPFIVFEVSDSSTADWVGNVVNQDSEETTLMPYGSSKGTLRYNLKAHLGTDDLQYFFFKVYSGDLIFDYIKIYSIANFTVSQSGTSADDILYVDSNILYCSGTSFTSFVLDHDPVLNISLYRGWNMNTSSGTPEVDFYDGGWLGYSSDTAGEFSPDNTVTDVRLKFTDNANIISLTFFDAINWQQLDVAILPFSVPFEEWGFQVALIILGLCMIPGSTLYLAYGIKHDRSSNRLFYGLIAFILGFGLLVAGVMP